MSSPTPAESAAAQTTDLRDVDEENGALAWTLNMFDKKIDMVIDKAGCMPPDDEDDKKANNDAYLSDVIESSGMGRPNRNLQMTTEWALFPTPAWYDDYDGGASDVILVQGPWFDLSALE